MTATCMATAVDSRRTSIATQLRTVVDRATEDYGHDIRRHLNQALNPIPPNNRPQVTAFVYTWINIAAGECTACQDFFDNNPGPAGEWDGVCVYDDPDHYRTEALRLCSAAVQDVVDLALGGWSVEATPVGHNRPPADIAARLTRAAAEAVIADRIRWCEGLTFRAVPPAALKVAA